MIQGLWTEVLQQGTHSLLLSVWCLYKSAIFTCYSEHMCPAISVSCTEGGHSHVQLIRLRVNRQRNGLWLEIHYRSQIQTKNYILKSCFYCGLCILLNSLIQFTLLIWKKHLWTSTFYSKGLCLVLTLPSSGTTLAEKYFYKIRNSKKKKQKKYQKPPFLPELIMHLRIRILVGYYLPAKAMVTHTQMLEF